MVDEGVVLTACIEQGLEICYVSFLLGCHVVDIAQIGIKACLWGVVGEDKGEQGYDGYEPVILLYLPLGYALYDGCRA